MEALVAVVDKRLEIVNEQHNAKDDKLICCVGYGPKRLLSNASGILFQEGEKTWLGQKLNRSQLPNICGAGFSITVANNKTDDEFVCA
jgi:hypothetical protein